jgi:hypothetical protein
MPFHALDGVTQLTRRFFDVAQLSVTEFLIIVRYCDLAQFALNRLMLRQFEAVCTFIATCIFLQKFEPDDYRRARFQTAPKWVRMVYMFGV